jgi:hypothetical protein
LKPTLKLALLAPRRELAPKPIKKLLPGSFLYWITIYILRNRASLGRLDCIRT